MIADEVGWDWPPGVPEPGIAPLDLAGVVGRAGWDRLPPAIRRRFAAGHVSARYHGAMDFDRSGAGLLFALVSALVGGPLPFQRGTGVGADVTVTSRGAAVLWDRQLRCPGGTVAVHSAKQAIGDGTVLERTSCRLGMVLDVFEDGGALVFQSRRYVLCIGPWLVPLPGWLTPGRCRVEHRAEGPDTFRFTLEMRHPVLGRTFWQAGLFTDATPHDTPHDTPDTQENRS